MDLQVQSSVKGCVALSRSSLGLGNAATMIGGGNLEHRVVRVIQTWVCVETASKVVGMRRKASTSFTKQFICYVINIIFIIHK